MWTGTYTAIVTPFRDGRLDEAALQDLIKAQIKGGVAGVVPVGSTGESPTLSYEEHIKVIELTVQFAARKIKVIAGTGANATSEAIYLTRQAEKAGADASLQVAPYYNRPTQEGLFRHFQAIAQATRLPIILYSIPSRCGVEIATTTVRRLAQECGNIVGIKESGGSADRVSQLVAACGEKFSILCGDDALTLPFMSLGAVGVVSVASNLAPKEVSAMVQACLKGDLKTARKMHYRLYPLFRDLFIETNPAPVKAALAMMGRMSEDCRLPLSPLLAQNKETLRQTLQALRFIK